MHAPSLVVLAAPPTVAVVRNIKADQLDAPTPCRDWNVGTLINHLLFWGPALEAAAWKDLVEPVPVENGSDWADRLEEGYGRLVAAWSAPAAWEGTTRLGGPMELPASMIGGMVLGELIVHGWDLARATGQQPDWNDDLLEFVLREVAATAEQGREMGVYGDAVPVPDSAPVLARVLGLTGRDPAWRP
jgi:uncharacterized protein (TIGR03086 family)